LSKTYRQEYGKRIHSALTVLAGEMAPTICTHQRLAPQADNLHHEMLPMFLPIETSTPDDPEPDRIDPHPEEPDRIDPGDPEPDDPEEPDRIDPDEHDPGDPEQAPVVG